ncbi:MAG TPA: T9SS type A sorting domain-containing protein, partial [Chitinophagales bacterium]|nr:T9SS type A sorting domain-containing protein [Chitinophagales bacterium]
GTPATGINELSKNGFKVFSTNASSIQIVADRALSENMNVAVFDVNGKVVANGLMASPNYTISASSFGAGIYFVRLGNDKQSFVTKVFVR